MELAHEFEPAEDVPLIDAFLSVRKFLILRPEEVARVHGVYALGGFLTDWMPGCIQPECQSDGSGHVTF